MTRRNRRIAVALVALMTLCSPSWAAWAHPDCGAGQQPFLSSSFAGLHERLGDVMGGPLGCEHVDPGTGNAYVQTTSGIALYEKVTDRFTFTNGRDFWSLSADGVTHWTGWHGQASPVASDTGQTFQDEQLTVASIGHYPKAEAATIVRSLDADGRQLVLQRANTSYLVETQGTCSDGEPLEGRAVFVVSPEGFAEPGSRLILRIAGRECAITASRTS